MGRLLDFLMVQKLTPDSCRACRYIEMDFHHGMTLYCGVNFSGKGKDLSTARPDGAKELPEIELCDRFKRSLLSQKFMQDLKEKWKL